MNDCDASSSPELECEKRVSWLHVRMHTDMRRYAGKENMKSSWSQHGIVISRHLSISGGAHFSPLQGGKQRSGLWRRPLGALYPSTWHSPSIQLSIGPAEEERVHVVD
jgi:hypothetical protein